MTVTVTERTAPAARGAPTDTGQAFVAGPVASGPTDAPTQVRSLADFEAAYGARTGTSVALWDWLDVAFRNGLTHAYVGGYDTAGDWDDGLALFDPKYGPGQVAIADVPVPPAPPPGNGNGTTMAADTTLAEAIIAHVNAYNRVGLIDVPNSNVVADYKTLGQAIKALTDSAENVGVFSSWATAPGPAGVVGSGGRTVPASAVIAGLCAQVDQTGNPNRAAGGRDFPVSYITGFRVDPGDADRAGLFQAGVNSFKNVYGVLENYGFVTPVDRSPTTPFWQLNCARARMWLKAQSLAIGENYYMKPIDGEGKVAAHFGADLAKMCADLYAVDGLFGATPAEAYDVNVSQSVNTPDVVADATLKAVVQARFSQYADAVQVDLVSVPVAGVIS